MQPETVATMVIEGMAARYNDQLPLMPGAVEAVRRLAARWPLGLASSSPPSLIETVLDAASLRSSFAVAMSTEQVPHGNPAPDIYLPPPHHLRHPPARSPPPQHSPTALPSAP